MQTIQLAGGVIINKTNRILLIHRADARLNEWQIPGGKVEIGEAPPDTVIRELSEELGIMVAITRSLGVAAFTDPSINQVFAYEWFMATIVTGEPIIKEPDKFDAWRYLSWAELATMDAISPNVQNFLGCYPRPEALNEA